MRITFDVENGPTYVCEGPTSQELLTTLEKSSVKKVGTAQKVLHLENLAISKFKMQNQRGYI